MEIWGWKTTALFDAWSIEHFLGGVTIGAIVIYLLDIKSDKSRKIMYPIIILSLAYVWEYIEYHLEIGSTGIDAITYWFQGVEYWANRLISDPLLALVGSYVARYYTNLIRPARLSSVGWYIIHILIFPHCMYLHVIFN